MVDGGGVACAGKNMKRMQVTMKHPQAWKHVKILDGSLWEKEGLYHSI